MGFLEPQGPSSVETQGLFTSTILREQETVKAVSTKIVRIAVIFFIFEEFFQKLIAKKTKFLIEFFKK
jgi:hypothetical protein